MKAFLKIALVVLAFPAAILGARYLAFGETPSEAWQSVTHRQSDDSAETTKPSTDRFAAQRAAAKAEEAEAMKNASGRPIRVFFIGNSLTFYHEMPHLVERLAWADGINIRAEMWAPGGSKLSENAAQPEVQKKLDAGGWDYVVIQEQSEISGFAPEQVAAETFPAAVLIADRARAASPDVHVLLYVTPANKDGLATYRLPGVDAYARTQQQIIDNYTALGQRINALPVNVGRAWSVARSSAPDEALYADDRHPNATGAYLIACVFYYAITERSPVGNSFLGGLDESTARWVQQMASQR